MPEAIPANSFLHQLEVVGVRNGQRIWRSGTGCEERYYTWDALHGEVEVFNGRLRHLGAMDAVSGAYIKRAVKGRRLAH